VSRHPALPLVADVEVADPLAAVRSLAHLPHPFLLHSALCDRRARWSFFGADPFAVFRGDGYPAARALWSRLSRRVRAGDPPPVAAPFSGGVVGYWAYDFGRRLERLPAIARDDLGLPDNVLAFYDVVGAYDHHRRRAWVFSSGLPVEDPWRPRRARGRLERHLGLLAEGGGQAPAAALRPRAERGCLPSTFSPDGYRRAVEELKERIAAGDLFQANLSQRWTCAVEPGDPAARALAIQHHLAALSPAPHAAFLAASDHALASASPERFLELRGHRVETRPIKGTRPRSPDPAADARRRAALLASAKDRAENVMIVDVLRNDLGRVCEPGTVETASLCELEAFPQVFHLTSTVRGRLAEPHDAFDLLHACFPGGSITGAPKIRAMEVLDGLEPVRRHAYTGSIGYVDFGGDADWSIAIRTALVTPAAVHFSAGGGITADSDPDEEYRETLHKAEGLVLALGRLLGPLALAPEPAAASG
jgi:para-aminobenzoate synthetase component 1